MALAMNYCLNELLHLFVISYEIFLLLSLRFFL